MVYELPTPPEFRPADPLDADACHAEGVVDADRRPLEVRVNGRALPRVVRAERRWEPGQIPTLLVELEPTFFVETQQDPHDPPTRGEQAR